MTLSGKSKILIMATDGFEESELFGPLEILRSRGVEVKIAAPDLKPIQATVLDDPGRTIRPDLAIGDARSEDFDALILPGGVRNPDTLRTNPAAIALIRDFDREEKPVASICHGPWLLVEADIVRGRTVTCWKSIRTDLRNAGANLVDQPVAVDGNLVTSRMPEDVEQFAAAIIGALEAAAAKKGSAGAAA